MMEVVENDLFYHIIKILREKVDELKTVYFRYNDLSRSPMDDLYRYAEDAKGEASHYCLIAETYGYYLLMLQIPAIQRVEKLLDESENVVREPIVELPPPFKSVSFGEVYCRVKIWLELAKALQEEPAEINDELVEAFRQSP